MAVVRGLSTRNRRAPRRRRHARRRSRLMQRPIKPEWLLRLARELAGERAGQGQPRNTNLRRATSSAYYALFHGIALAVADEALPSASDNELMTSEHSSA